MKEKASPLLNGAERKFIKKPETKSDFLRLNIQEVERMLTMLKNLRRERKMTQGNLARIFHISQTSVSKYETGESVPDLEMVVKMADFFGVSLDDFIIREAK